MKYNLTFSYYSQLTYSGLFSWTQCWYNDRNWRNHSNLISLFFLFFDTHLLPPSGIGGVFITPPVTVTETKYFQFGPDWPLQWFNTYFRAEMFNFPMSDTSIVCLDRTFKECILNRLPLQFYSQLLQCTSTEKEEHNASDCWSFPLSGYLGSVCVSGVCNLAVYWEVKVQQERIHYPSALSHFSRKDREEERDLQTGHTCFLLTSTSPQYLLNQLMMNWPNQRVSWLLKQAERQLQRWGWGGWEVSLSERAESIRFVDSDSAVQSGATVHTSVPERTMCCL